MLWVSRVRHHSQTHSRWGVLERKFPMESQSVSQALWTEYTLLVDSWLKWSLQLATCVQNSLSALGIMQVGLLLLGAASLGAHLLF